jgi:hypothetical protein
MIIKGGYIKGTVSTRTHPVTNIAVKASDIWTRISIKIDKTILTVCNIGKDMHFDLKISYDDYNCCIYNNNKLLHSQSGLFEYELEIDTDDTSIIKTMQSFVYDC